MGFWKTLRSIQDADIRAKYNQEYFNSSLYQRDSKIIEEKKEMNEQFMRAMNETDEDIKVKKIHEFNHYLQTKNIYNKSFRDYESGKCTIYSGDKDNALKVMKEEQDPVRVCSMKRLYDNQIYNFDDLY